MSIKNIEQFWEFHVMITFMLVGEVLIKHIVPIGLREMQVFLKDHGADLHFICYIVTDINKALRKVNGRLKL